MNRMACTITDGPQDDQIAVDFPAPIDLFYMLPNGEADELVSDEVEADHKTSNRSYLSQMFKLDSEGRGEELHKLMDEVRHRIGESEYAQNWFLRNLGD